MKFDLSREHLEKIIKDVVSRRLTNVDSKVRAAYPEIFQSGQVAWVSFFNGAVVGLLFLDPSDLQRVHTFQAKGWDPFPGLFTTEDNIPAAFRLENSRFNTFKSCSVLNSYAFSIGKDCTFFIEAHHQTVTTPETGELSFTLPLAYFVSLGEEITPYNLSEHLDELVAYSVKSWGAL